MNVYVRKSKRNEWKDGWMLVVSSYFVKFIVDGFLYSFGIMLVEIIDHFHEGRASTGAVMSLASGIRHLIGPVAGALADKYGHRNIVVVGALLSCAGFILSSFASNIYHLWITYGVLGGLGFGLMYLPSSVCVLQHFQKHRTLANGIAVSGSGTGTFAFNQITRLLIDQYGWRGTFLLEAGFVLQGVVLGLLLPRQPKEDPQSDETRTLLASNVKSLLSSVFKIELLKDLRLTMFLLSTLGVSLAFVIPFTFLPDQVEQTGMTKTEAATLISSIGIANTIGRIVSGWIGDRICFSGLIQLEILSLLLGLVSGFSPFMSTFVTKLAYSVMFGFLMGGYIALYTVALVEMFRPELISNAFGLVELVVGIAEFIATPVTGLLFDLTGSYDMSFVICGVEFLVAGFFLLMCKLFGAKK